MNINIRFLQSGGVPLTNDLMDKIQEAYALFGVLGSVTGSLTILSGCQVTGNVVEPGVVSINGEVLPMHGGTLGTTVYIHSELIERTFEDLTDKVLIEERSVRFGSALQTFSWSSFVRINDLRAMQQTLANAATSQQITAIEARLATLERKTAPIFNGGVIFPFRRPVAQIPAGWKECTDFRGKTIVGMDPNYMASADNIDYRLNVMGATGGSREHYLTVEEMPIHSHEQGSESLFNIYGGGTTGGGTRTYPEGPYPSYTNQNTSNAGQGGKHTNMAPYRVAMFIEPNF